MSEPITIFVARRIITLNPSNPAATHVDAAKAATVNWRRIHLNL